MTLPDLTLDIYLFVWLCSCVFHNKSLHVSRCLPELCEPFQQIIETEEDFAATLDRSMCALRIDCLRLALKVRTILWD